MRSSITAVLAACLAILTPYIAAADYQIVASFQTYRIGGELPPSHLGDFDCDGHMELVGSHPTNGTYIRVYDLVTGMAEVLDLPVPDGNSLTSVHVCDTDGDGTPEAMLLSGVNVYVLKFVGAPTALPEGEEGPLGQRLRSPSPNPSDAQTTITFTLARAGRANLRLFDVSGRVVRQIVDNALPPGQHSFKWDMKDDAGNHVASGAYFYELRLDGEPLGAERITVIR